MKRALAAALGALPAIALCASVLALGLIAGFLLAAPLTPQVSRCRKEESDENMESSSPSQSKTQISSANVAHIITVMLACTPYASVIALGLLASTPHPAG